ncbi:hypothetical protein JW979_06785 [bacterium]|nr:hypothetical protein [candidate division CSSED10-310 bacterium]
MKDFPLRILHLKTEWMILSTVALCVTLGFVSLNSTGCATTSYRQNIEVGSLNEVPMNEVFVMGRITIGDGKIHFFSPSSYLVLVKEENTNQDFTKISEYRLDGDGHFFWHLHPGKYIIVQVINNDSSYRVMAEFVVPDDQPAIYIGTLNLCWFRDGDHNMIRFRISDEYPSAFDALTARFGEYQHEITKSIMTMGVVQ